MKFGFKRFALALCVIVATAALAFALSACSDEDEDIHQEYNDADKYVAAHTFSVSPTFSELEIDWVSGAVVIVGSKTATEVTISEAPNMEASEALTMHYYNDGVTLRVRYGESSRTLKAPKGFEKPLTVTIPTSLALNYLDVKTVTSSVTLSNVAARHQAIDTVSGAVKLSTYAQNLASAPEEISVGTVSAWINAVVSHPVTELKLESGSGDIRLDVTEGGVSELDVETLSGNLNIHLDALVLDCFAESLSGLLQMTANVLPLRLKLETASSDIGLKLNPAFAFEMNVFANVTATSFNGLVIDGRKYTYAGEGGMPAEVEVRSERGTLRLER